MKQKIKKLLGCLLTLALTVGMVQYLGYLVRPVTADAMIQAVNTFHKLPEDSVEVIGVGSSHMWHGLDANTLYEEYGIGFYNYGCDWQHINTTSLFLQDALRTQSPKVVIIETFRVDQFLENTDITGEIYYTTAIADFPGKREFLKQCFGDDPERYLSYYMPLCGFHDNWVNLSRKSFAGIPDDDRFAKTMGSMLSDRVEPVTVLDPETFVLRDIPETGLAELDKMVALCREKGAQVVLYTAPVGGDYFYYEAMREYAKANDCAYVELFSALEEAGIDGNTDFLDVGHLNTAGARKAARYMGQFLKEHYDLTDMRQVENNIWVQQDWAK